MGNNDKEMDIGRTIERYIKQHGWIRFEKLSEMDKTEN